eukprot:CAMPEP_0181238250 /NCGR_PEP_ID=MMETSP1096-20121128/39233_1 /TAXON_ID=156174 ORGANISM="Chrysochromulina ericina, Strain CCMP281" /NCGR_SAMPLE_ID=MMETSP1096 /ASSEMBLY_ACC=CAM_ASM_000453 /LENGTH=494 /DNA_ID=CAMNT_0023333733 /DNA_START=1419 /DNA_END=2903 /DNA_ORIENTATION=+
MCRRPASAAATSTLLPTIGCSCRAPLTSVPVLEMSAVLVVTKLQQQSLRVVRLAAEREQAERAEQAAAQRMAKRRADDKAHEKFARAALKQRATALRESWLRSEQATERHQQPVEPPLTLAIANLSDALAVAALPAVEEIPRCSVVDICRSLVLVLRALQFNCNLRDLRAAESCFRSWTQTSWVDPVSRVAKKKPRHGWTLEQYAQPGFAVSYARKLHVPRVAATRQLMLWLLEHAPGLPDGHLSVGDLGAGTCAACLGAHLAVRDLVGEGHPLTLHPIDAASSSSRFHRSFAALTRKVPFSKPPPMPLASTSSEYLVSTAGNVDDLARSLFRQLDERGARTPHILLASFVLHYLDAQARDSFFTLLGHLTPRPFILVIIKGVGLEQRPPDWVRSAFFGIHYFAGERQPRVCEAHACLILPQLAPAAAQGEKECSHSLSYRDLPIPVSLIRSVRDISLIALDAHVIALISRTLVCTLCVMCVLVVCGSVFRPIV